MMHTRNASCNRGIPHSSGIARGDWHHRRADRHAHACLGKSSPAGTDHPMPEQSASIGRWHGHVLSMRTRIIIIPGVMARPTPGWWFRIAPYLNSDGRLMHCPAWDGYTLWGVEGWGYGYNMQATRLTRQYKVKNGAILLADAYWYFCSQHWAVTWIGSASAAWNYDHGNGGWEHSAHPIQNGGVYKVHNRACERDVPRWPCRFLQLRRFERSDVRNQLGAIALMLIDRLSPQKQLSLSTPGCYESRRCQNRSLLLSRWP